MSRVKDVTKEYDDPDFYKRENGRTSDARVDERFVHRFDDYHNGNRAR